MPIALLRTYVTSKPERVLFLDPSINNTGWAEYRVCREEQQVRYRLEHYGLFTSPEACDDQDKMRYMERQLHVMLAHRGMVFGCFIEVPPDTIYEGKKLTKDMLIAKARSVFRTFAMAHLLAATLGRLNVPHCFILPVQWEMPKKRRNNIPVKRWHVLHANQILESVATTLDQNLSRCLSTTRDENIADAICMGWKLIPELLDGKWQFNR